jgi:HEAT repeat protein
LHDSDPVIRLHAAVILTELGEAALPAVPALLDALRAEDALLRRVAAWTLGWVGKSDSSVVAALTRASREDTDDRVRQTALQALESGELGSRAA